jgi:hypothetical protein
MEITSMACELINHLALKLRAAIANRSTINQNLILSGCGQFTGCNHRTLFA